MLLVTQNYELLDVRAQWLLSPRVTKVCLISAPPAVSGSDNGSLTSAGKSQVLYCDLSCEVQSYLALTYFAYR